MEEIKDTEQKEKTVLSFLDKYIQKELRKKRRHRLYRDLIMTAAIIYILFNIITGIAVVQKESMNPNITAGSITLFYRLERNYKRNDIVIFRTPYSEELLIKRIVAVEGDNVDIDNETGALLINDNIQEENFIIQKTYSREGGVTFPLSVPAGSVFVLGDNREVSLDSRDFGTINTANLVGKVVFEIKSLLSN